MKPEQIQGEINIRPFDCRVHFNVADRAKCFNFRESKRNPHYGLFHMVMNYMRKRGFVVGLDPDIEEHYKILSPDHRYGHKNGLEFCADRYPAGFKIQFFQNESQSENRNGGKFDFNKYKKFPYRLKLTVRNECNRLGQYLESKGITVNYIYPVRNAEKKLLQHYQEAHWLRVKPTTLSEVQSCLSEYIVNHNSKDRDGKQIICGQVKYFYDSKRRLMCGKVYHNINNMWWVVLNDTDYTNLSDFSLFDFEPGKTTFKLELTDHQKLNRIKSEMDNAMKSMNFERCIVLKKILKSYNTEPLFVIYSKKNSAYWRQSNSGYCSDIAKAGLYFKSEIDRRPNYYNDGINTVAQPALNNFY